MKIDASILSIPPYISTSWNSVIALSMDESALVVDLSGGTRIKIPSLPQSVLEQIFSFHAQYLQKKEAPMAKDPLLDMSFPLKLGLGGGVDALGSVLQHNPEQAHSPSLPDEILTKILSVGKMIGLFSDLDNLPKAEPHCNCPYCQIARSIHNQSPHKEDTEEEILDEDLTFRTWDIQQNGEKLYLVTNPLDANENYQVFLGNPVGCTCGEKNCEHIKAVLHS